MKNNIEEIYKEFGQNICFFPFMSVFYSQMLPESIRPCSIIGQFGGESVIDNDLIKSFNHPQWQQLRKHFLTESCHTIEACKTCSLAEISNNDSPRKLNNIYFVEHLKTDIISHVKNIKDNNYQADKIITLDYAPSNYCNFECVMCSGGVSSTRNTFEIKFQGKKHQQRVKFSHGTDFYQLLDNVEILNLCGGEPLLQTEVHKLIDYLIEHDLAKNMTISLLTNASKYPEKLIDKFQQFKNVFYTISIDGVDNVIEYQRRGCKWSETEQVALRLINNFGCIVNYVVTAINVFSFIDTVDWFAKNNIDKVVLSLVFDANKNISVKVIPPAIKGPLLEKLKLNTNRYSNNKLNDLIVQMISILENNDFVPDLLPAFKEQISIEDLVSKHKLIEVVPEWAPYFNDKFS